MSDVTIDPFLVDEVATNQRDDHSERTDGERVRVDREARLREGADQLRRARALSLLQRPNFLIGVAATLMTIGLSLILMGWVGAARSIHLEEQVPYLISGGIFGGALAIIGAVTLFTHWLTVGIRESRARGVVDDQHHAELIAALERLAENTGGGGNDGDPGGHRLERPLRATPRRS